MPTTKMKPNIKSSFIYEDKKILVDWYDLLDKKLPDIKWQQVYAIGNLDGKVPLVFHPDGHHNLPGGQVEPGEDVFDAMQRELAEEVNMRATQYHLLGYQRLTDPDGKQVNQLRVYAKLEKIGEFVSDPGGTVIGHKLVNLEDINDYINYGPVGERLIELARPSFQKTRLEE